MVTKSLDQACLRDFDILSSSGMLALTFSRGNSTLTYNSEVIQEKRASQHFEITRTISRMAQTAATAPKRHYE